MDVSFLENTPFFTKNSLQGEKIGEEANFREKSAPYFQEKSTPLRNTIVGLPSQDTKTCSTEFSLQITKFFPEKESSIQDVDMGKISLLPTEKEILQKDTFNPNSELQVYTRKRMFERYKGPPIIPVQNP